MVALGVLQVGEQPAEFAQLLAGRQALLLQTLVVLPQVGHLGQQHHFVLLLLVCSRYGGRREERGKEGGRDRERESDGRLLIKKMASAFLS